MIIFIEEKFSFAAEVTYSGGSTNHYKHRQYFISVTSCKEDFGMYGIFCWKE
jgi:hypothetical protein